MGGGRGYKGKIGLCPACNTRTFRDKNDRLHHSTINMTVSYPHGERVTLGWTCKNCGLVKLTHTIVKGEVYET